MNKFKAGTTGYLLEDGYGIGLHCEAPGCHHFAWADLPALVERLGTLQLFIARPGTQVPLHEMRFEEDRA